MSDTLLSDPVFLKAFLEDAGDPISDDSEILAQCESPIERRFGAAFILYSAMLEGRPYSKRFENYAPRPPIVVEPQHVIDKFRLDFLIYYAGTPPREAGIAVECDGHDFHEKTKAQAARDKARDRTIQGRVSKLIRFTGSEIHYRPFECASEAYGFLDGLYCDWGMRR